MNDEAAMGVGDGALDDGGSDAPWNYRPLVSNLLLFCLIFGMSATVEFGHFQEQVRNGRAIGTGLFLQFVILPLLGFLVVKVGDFDPVMGIMLLVITSSPGGAYSNWFCSLFNADLALSVTMTAASTVLSMGFLPLNIYMYSHLTYPQDVLGALNWVSLGISLAVVVSSIVAGLAVSHHYSSRRGDGEGSDGDDDQGQRVRGLINKFGNLAGLGLILFGSLASEGGRITLPGKEPVFYYGNILPIAFGLASSVIITSLARLERPERVTVGVEVVYQNTAIAMTSALSLFPDPDDQREAVAVPFWYTGMQTAFTGVFCLIAWQCGWTKAPRNVNPIKMLVESYEVAEATAPGAEATEGNGAGDENGRDGGGGGGGKKPSDDGTMDPLERIRESPINRERAGDEEEARSAAESFRDAGGGRTGPGRRTGTEDTAASGELAS